MDEIRHMYSILSSKKRSVFNIVEHREALLPRSGHFGCVAHDGYVVDPKDSIAISDIALAEPFIVMMEHI